MIPVSGSVVQDRPVRRLRVFDGLSEVPFPRLHRQREVALGQLPLGSEWNLDRSRIADGLGQQPDHVLEVRRGSQATVPPRRVRPAGSHGRAPLPLLDEPPVHRGPDRVEAREDERIEVGVGRIPEGRSVQNGARRTRLVVIVDDLGKPLLEQHPVDVGGLGKGGHVEITIVVVPRILLVQDRQPPRAAPQRVGLAHVPVGDQLHAVRINLNRQQDHLVEDAQGLRVGAADHTVNELHELLRTEDFRGV